MAIVIRESTKFGKFWHFAISSSIYLLCKRSVVKVGCAVFFGGGMSKTEVTKNYKPRDSYIYAYYLPRLGRSLWILVCDVIAPTSFKPNFVSIGSGVSDFRHHNFLILRSLSCRPYNSV